MRLRIVAGEGVGVRDLDQTNVTLFDLLDARVERCCCRAWRIEFWNSFASCCVRRFSIAFQAFAFNFLAGCFANV